MDSKIVHSQQHCDQNNTSRGLSRYCSAPSSLLTSLIDTRIGFFNEETLRNDHHHDENHEKYSSSTNSKMDTILTNCESLYECGVKPMKQEEKDPFLNGLQFNGYSYGSSNQMIYQELHNGFDSNNCSNLIRQKSSPAEFFSNYSIDSGFAPLREVGSARGYDVTNGEATKSTSGLHGTLNFSSRNIANDNGSTKCYMPSFTNDYWDSSTFSAPKTSTYNGEIMFSTSNTMETQDVNFGCKKLGLSHHLSLPSSSTKEKYFHIQGSVPCKIRAKRGFATHPRSIAERERRIRISARIKKLQDLFPNSDKQTSTAEMLDLAVDYIKDLRKQIKILSETKAKCTCTSN